MFLSNLEYVNKNIQQKWRYNGNDNNIILLLFVGPRVTSLFSTLQKSRLNLVWVKSLLQRRSEHFIETKTARPL